MIRDRIVFRHGIQIAFRAVDGVHFSTEPDPGHFDFSDTGLAVFFFRPDPTRNTEQTAALEALSAAHGVECLTVEMETLEPEQFSFLHEIFRKLKSSLGSRRNVTIFYPRDAEEQVVLMACMFLLTVQVRAPKAISPENSLKYFTGSDKEVSGKDLVYRFQEFLENNAAGLSVPAIGDEAGRSAAAAALPSSDNGHGSEDHESSDSASKPDPAPVLSAAPEPSAVARQSVATPPPTPVPARAPAAPPAGGAAPEDSAEASNFKSSKFTIQVKMLSIITGIIILSLGSMIYFASNFFQSDSESRIQENNLNLARVIGKQVQSELENIRFKSQLAVSSFERAEDGDVADLFFKNNPDVLFLGLADSTGGALNITRRWLNGPQLQSLGFAPEDFNGLAQEGRDDYIKALGGALSVINASRGQTPMIGISMPWRAGLLLVFLEPSKFLGSFQREEGLVKTFMVDSEGIVIAHPDGKRVLARQNLSDLGIVATMLESATDNGNTVYDEEDVEFLGSFAKLSVGGLGVISTVNSDEAFKAVRRIRDMNLFIMGIVMALAFVVIYFFAKTMTVPVVSLVDATQQVERGDYAIDIKPTTRDEIGKLTDSFARMARGLGEREKLKDAMVKFVNKQVADLALRGEIKLGGEQREKVAVFFSDLRGFTAMSEKMTAEEVVSYLNEYFTGMVSCVNQTNGIVDKFIGDAVMAHWGAFESHGNDTENAIMGALMMRTAIIEFNERSDGNRPFAKQGCGINTGPLVSGQIGSEERFEFTVIGDTVNLASRIEALNKPFGTDILISADSYEEVKDIFKVEPQPAIKVKGKAEPQVIYAVVGRFDDPDCPADMDEVRKMLGIEFDSSQAVDPDAKEEKFEVVGG